MPCNVIAYNHSSTMIQFFPDAVGNFPFTISLSVFSSPLPSLPNPFSSCDKAKKTHSLTPASHCPNVSVTVSTSEVRGATLFLGQQIRDTAGMGHGIAHILSCALSPCIEFLQHTPKCTSSDFLK